MKIGTFLALAVGVWIIGVIVCAARAQYEYDRTIGSYWELSDKASTLQQKSAYLDQYVAALQQPGRFAPNDATIFPTPSNSYEQNMVALNSLQGRMHQIQGMDEQSFAYQTAIQQITQQEQGEALELTSTFEGCWFLQNHYFLWSWHLGVLATVLGLLLILGIIGAIL